MKTCSKCNENKELKDFHNCKINSDGLYNWCKNCKKEYDYMEVTSVFIRHQEDIEKIKKLMNYTKNCECGIIFDMSKNKIGYNLAINTEEIKKYFDSFSEMTLDEANSIVQTLLDEIK